jgi:putative transposase
MHKPDVLRAAMEGVCAELIEIVDNRLAPNAASARMTHCKGYPPRTWPTRTETVEPPIPKRRRGSYFLSFPEPRRRSEQALLAVIQQAYVCRFSTRRVDRLAMGVGLRVGKSEVSRNYRVRHACSRCAVMRPLPRSVASALRRRPRCFPSGRRG